jgi:CIC family chloride channel protein
MPKFIQNLLSTFDREERRLVFQSVMIGVVVWLIVFLLREAVHWLFHTNLHWLETIDHGPTLLLVLLPLLAGALVVAGLSRIRPSIIHYRDADGKIHELNDLEGDGLERAISLYYSSEPTFEQVLKGQEGLEVRWELPTFSLAARKFLATLATLGSGGSGGLEASVTLIGESVSAGLFKPHDPLRSVEKQSNIFARAWEWWQADDPDDLQTAQLSGIAAAVSVLLGAPFAAAFFATEVMYRHRPIIEKLVYALLSALVAYFLTDLFTAGHTAIFEVEQLYVPPNSWTYYGVVLLLAGLISLVSILFGRLRARVEHDFHHLVPNVWQRHLLGALLTGLIAIAVAIGVQRSGLHPHGLELVLGPGETVINDALAGELLWSVAFIALGAKMLATLATIGSGGSAGLLVPSLFFGTMVAAALADLFGFPAMTLIIPGMTASLVSIVNVPMAAILFSVEVFGTGYMVPALLTLIVTTILAHDHTIYRTQREKHGKRQVLPGVSSRRIPVPPSWSGKSLIELDFRNQFALNVVGLLERRDEYGAPRIRLDLPPTHPLEEGDMLVVLGKDEMLDKLETAVRAERGRAWFGPEEEAE